MKDQQSTPKKKKRIWLYILSGFLLILLGIAGFIVYEFKIKQYDVADPVVDEIIDENYVIELPDGKQLVIDKEGQIVEEIAGETPSTTDTNAQPTGSTGNGVVSNSNDIGSSNTNNNETNNNETDQTTKKQSVASIKEKYKPTLEALQAQANSKITGIIEQAKGEYVSKKSNGESISFGYFYNKYMGAADALEASTDAAFNSIITIIESELEQNGYSRTHVSTLREEYNAMKETRRSNLLNKALELL